MSSRYFHLCRPGKAPGRASALLVFAAGVLLPALAASAQVRQTGVDIYEEQLRVRLDQQVPTAREVGLDYGGWFNFAVFDYDDAAAARTRTLRQFQLRGWASVNVQGVHRGYVRGLLAWDDWKGHDNTIAGRGDTFDDELERAWYLFDFGQLLFNQTGQQPPVAFKVKVGRDFATIGTAFVLAIPLDMVQFNIDTANWRFMTLLGKTKKDTNNIDDSARVAHHMDRCFFGAELAYRGLDNHEPFVYFLTQQDHTSPASADAAQSYDYSSRYLGVGSTGTVVSPDLRYRAEAVGEWGKTYSENMLTDQDRICAWALDAGLEYLPMVRMRPKLTAEYMFGSGDSDRRLSANSTVGGNRAGTKDEAFNAFGFRDTGIAFAPRVSNIHIYTAGASFFPLEKHELFRKMEIGTKIFLYHKAKAGGPISDTTATKGTRWLGWEWDVFCDWRLTSDLAWTIRYGLFRPGAAFGPSANSGRHMLYTGVIFSF